MRKHIRHSLRLIAIARILAKHGALFLLRDLGVRGPALWFGLLFSRRSKLPQGERLARALEELGPAFIKLGQILSTRPDLVGADVAEALSSLRDRLPPFLTARARTIVADELKQPVDALFSEFSNEPFAAASIAQVHKATRTDGRVVAVKILRPNIEARFARDMDLFEWLARLVERNLPEYRRLKPVEIVATLRQSVAFELDLRFEAAAGTEFAKNIAADTGFRVPKVHWRLTSQRVLVTDWVDGTPISDLDALRSSGHDLNALMTRLAENFFSHVFRDGFFHADLHPGNLFVDSAGTIVAVDFGIMGRLDWHSRIYIAEIFRGFLSEDYQRVAEVHFKAGYVPDSQSVSEFKQACMAICKPILDRPMNEISVARLLGQLFAITEQFHMETQPQLLLLQKTMVVVEGVGRMLNPGVNMWEMARGPIEQWARDNLGLKGQARNAAWDIAEHVQRLPEILTRLDNTLRHLSDPAGIRLHPITVEALAAPSLRASRSRLWLGSGWVVALGLASIELIRRFSH